MKAVHLILALLAWRDLRWHGLCWGLWLRLGLLFLLGLDMKRSVSKYFVIISILTSKWQGSIQCTTESFDLSWTTTVQHQWRALKTQRSFKYFTCKRAINMPTQQRGIWNAGFLGRTFFLPVTFHSFRISTALPKGVKHTMTTKVLSNKRQISNLTITNLSISECPEVV